MIDRSRIRVKAFAVLFDAARRRHVVSRMATTEHPVFHRPLGGSIEFGERAIDAVQREVREELDATVRDIALLGVLENIFTIDGELGHEIVFVYGCTLDDESTVPEGGRVFHDLDVEGWAEWRDVGDSSDVPLLPDGLQPLIDRHVADRAASGSGSE